MSHNTTLISFLGRTRKGEHGYRTTSYAFADGSVSAPLAFFGWALHARLQPDRMVILGTSGSMWDHLFEGDFDFADTQEEQRLALVDAVEEQRVEQPQLDALAASLASRLGCAVSLRIIPYCRNIAEQTALLHTLADEVGEAATVDLDITHGLRHLPMLALLAALYLQRACNAHIRSIQYGAYDPDSHKAEVMDLGGLLHIADWLDALSVYDHTGDYGVFAELLAGSTGNNLAEAGFQESVQRIGQARSRLKKVDQQLRQTKTDDPALGLFLPELSRRIDWAQGDNYYLRQRTLCYEYLQRERYRDAILTGWEAFTTRLQRQAGGQQDPDNYSQRDQVRDHFEHQQRQQTPRTAQWQAYDSLRRLRNAVAHGSQPKGEEVQRALGDKRAMHALLGQLLAQLLPEQPT